MRGRDRWGDPMAGKLSKKKLGDGFDLPPPVITEANAAMMEASGARAQKGAGCSQNNCGINNNLQPCGYVGHLVGEGLVSTQSWKFSSHWILVCKPIARLLCLCAALQASTFHRGLRSTVG